MNKSFLKNLPILLISLSFCRADVTLAPLFTPHAVLQQGMPVPVWGKASTGEQVTVAYLGQTQTAAADSEGRWSVKLAPMEAGQTGELLVTGKNTIRLPDVVTGEVWLAGGQSNMTMPVKQAINAAAEIAAADYPMIREFRPGIQVSDAPLDTAGGTWQICSPKTAPNFSAIGYFFARDLHQNLKMPIGIINSNKGGSFVEAWMSAEAFATHPHAEAVRGYLQAATERWQKKQAPSAAREPGEAVQVPAFGPGGFGNPSVLYNGMIHPFIPYAIQGVIWNQGEANVQYSRFYRDLFSDLIQDWRHQWKQGDFPFLFCQLPNISKNAGYDPTGLGYPLLREAQLQSLAVPNTGMIVTLDIGDLEDRHFRNKQEAGRRLALLAKAMAYGQAIDCFSPVQTTVKVEGKTMRVFFDHSYGKLATSNGQPPAGFEIAGQDRAFHPAEAVIDNDSLVLSSSAVPEPIAARYAWTTNPEGANLVNSAGLPASPFQTDDWQDGPAKK